MSSPAAPGRVLSNRYRLVHHLARGGMASVWVADDTLLGRRVAVKILHGELAAHEDVRVRFRNEAIAAAGLSHPGIVATFDTGEDDGLAFIVMELVQGPNLRRVLDERGPLPPREALRIARGVAVALDHAHRKGIVHRDVKPANVLVPPDGPVKVTDFGIAKAAGSEDLTRSGTIVGTARYLAPEQVRGEPADGRADVYALGLLLHEMLTGTLPFHGDTEMATALARLAVPPAPLPPNIPPAVASVERQCLAVAPDERYPSAHALAEALDQAAGGGAVHDATLPPAAPVTRARDRTATTVAAPAAARPVAVRRRRAAWPFALLGALLLVGGAAAGYLIVRSTQDDSSNGARAGTGTTTSTVHLVAAHDFDPEGNNGEENRAEVGLAIDGKPLTAWSTEIYTTPDFGHSKSGVGIYFDLATSTDVSKVEIDTSDTGWSAQIYVVDAPAPTTLKGWGAPRASGQGLSRHATLRLDPSARGKEVLVWITRLPQPGDAGGSRLDVAEVRVA